MAVGRAYAVVERDCGAALNTSTKLLTSQITISGTERDSNARVRGKPGARADLAYYTCVLGYWYHASSMWGGLFGTSATMHGACMDYEAMLRVGE